MGINMQGSDPNATTPTSTGGSPSAWGGRSTFKSILVLLSFALLWFVLISQLRVEWTVDPQYSYGWVVPFLCLGLFLRRWQTIPQNGRQTVEGRNEKSEPRPGSPANFSHELLKAPCLIALFATLAFLVLPLRLVLEANPNWPSPQWLLAGIVIALTLMTVYRSLGAGCVRQLAFPVCFVLVAVAWPPSIETPLIQGLTHANVATTIECVGWLEIPATQHANVIEISTGMVGVNEACSGIRSFQSSIMITLFLGEFYRLRLRRRVLLLLLGFIAAFGFNVFRTSLLVLVASKHGIAAIDSWHDPAGVTITVACTLVLWGVALWLRKPETVVEKLKAEIGGEEGEPAECRKQKSEIRSQQSVVSGQRSVVPGQLSKFQLFASPSPGLFRLSLALLVWLVIVEAGVEAWYRVHDQHASNIPEWTLRWPPQITTFRERAIPTIDWEILKYDEGHYGVWASGDNLDFLMYYFRWSAGKIAASSASSHTPDVCLTAAGKKLDGIGDDRSPITIGSLVFPFRRYEFIENGAKFYVFYCLWEEQTPGRYFTHDAASGIMDIRLRNVLEGRRNLGQRSIEIMVSGAEDAKSAQVAVASQFAKLIKIQVPKENHVTEKAGFNLPASNASPREGTVLGRS